MPVLAFDVYGTLIDPHSMEEHLRRVFGAKAKAAAELWREKQVEFSFRRALMQKYVNFDTCTAQALVYVSGRLGVTLSGEENQALLAQYLCLPAFPDVASGLKLLREQGHRIVAFSNGTKSSVRRLLEQAALLEQFTAIISVDEIKTFKPDPAVYEHLARRLGTPKESVWLISSNPWDVIGAKSCGLRTVWLQRDASSVFDPWEFSPDFVIRGMEDLCAQSWMG